MKSTHFSKSDLLYGASRLIDDQNDAKVRQLKSVREKTHLNLESGITWNEFRSIFMFHTFRRSGYSVELLSNGLSLFFNKFLTEI